MTTFRGEHGAAMPGGPFPGTSGEPGGVRRCEHGQVWVFEKDDVYGFDHWEWLSRVWNPVRYRRAVRALQRNDFRKEPRS
ncbi:hypothetical protein [Lentzea cavernae]|uniref:hypothetical protein n=1 Tax=Lentzea cavernae TaxID=2020703 RepID=UPI00174D9A9C|nr:hypothetical protein [Lentzea cavernae]